MRKSSIQNSRGVVVILVLWVLIILTALAVSLGKNAQIEMSLTKYAVGRLKSKHMARAGIMYGMNQLALDSQDTASNQEDTLYYCGVKKTDGTDMKELFKDRKLGDGLFSLTFVERDQEQDNDQVYYGLADEERRINLNALTIQNVNILTELLKLLEVETDTAKTIAYSIVDWIDQDGNKSDYRYGSESDYYESLSEGYFCKNRPLQSVEELILVHGVTLEILNKIRPYVAIFPSTGNLLINFDTASAIVLKALVYSFLEVAHVSPMDADRLVDKIISYRSGKDGKAFTSDDEIFDDTKTDFDSASDQNLYSMINQFRTKKSNYFRIRSEGKDSSGVKTVIEAVVSRENLEVLSWHRQ